MVWLCLKQAIFSLLRLRFFSAAGQFYLPFLYFSFDQALIQCSTALNQSAEFAPLEIATIS